MVEEHSLEVALQNLLPRMLPLEVSYQIIVFQGKEDLLRNLQNRLRGYASWIPEDFKITVLIDEDRQNCHDLKNRLERICHQSGLTTKTRNPGQGFQVLNRIVVEELESWFIGDVDALREAYNRIPESLSRMKKFRDPDSVPGGTWESLEVLLQRFGYFTGGYSKIQAARDISFFMVPDKNRSKSFQVFRDGLLALL